MLGKHLVALLFYFASTRFYLRHKSGIVGDWVIGYMFALLHFLPKKAINLSLAERFSTYSRYGLIV
ncbi:MAG: hypothetical protein ACI8W9_001360 [Psychromonas sp.]